MKIECSSQCEVTSICKRSYNKSWRASQVFIAIFKHCITVTHHAGMSIFIPLITQLPVKTSNKIVKRTLGHNPQKKLLAIPNIAISFCNI